MAALSFFRRITGQNTPVQAAAARQRRANENPTSLVQRAGSSVTVFFSNQNNEGPKSPNLSMRKWIYKGHPLFTEPTLTSVIASYLLGSSFAHPHPSFPLSWVLDYDANEIPGEELEQLDLQESETRLDVVTDKEITILAKRSPHLASVVIHSTEVTNASLDALGRHCKKLQSIDFEGSSVTMAGIIKLAKYLSLRSVVLNDNFSDVELAAFAKLTPHLTSIELGGCVTDEGLRCLARDCRSIKIIDLAYCEKISADGIEILVQSCPELTSINLSWCRQLSDASLVAIGKHCKQLTHINLNYCEQFSKASLQTLFRNTPRLTTAQLYYTSITDDELEVLAENCPYLTYIDVNNNWLITQAGLDALKKGCPRLKKIISCLVHP